MNNDGVTEVPQPVKMPGWGSGVTSDDGYRIDWYSYDSNGKGKIVMRTYHDMESGWYFQLPGGVDGPDPGAPQLRYQMRRW